MNEVFIKSELTPDFADALIMMLQCETRDRCDWLRALTVVVLPLRKPGPNLSVSDTVWWRAEAH